MNSTASTDDVELKLLYRNIPPNPITGKFEVKDVARYISKNAQMFAVFEEVFDRRKRAPETADATMNNDTYDFASLHATIKKDSYWYIKTMPNIDPASTTTGCLCCFMYDDEHHGLVRSTLYYSDSQPTPTALIGHLKSCFVHPRLLTSPSLPNLLFFPEEIQSQIPDIEPFLNALPAPFQWKVGSPDLTDQLREDAVAHALRRIRWYQDGTNTTSMPAMEYGKMAIDDIEPASHDWEVLFGASEELEKLKRQEVGLGYLVLADMCLKDFCMDLSSGDVQGSDRESALRIARI
ncbi:hypothetical protein Hypma_000457 [Hypsizygus marmoreus]|uniref:Uncharacterized protein n=1 Tax=Hypsizygus marmoreus TaxID=39966 RepID=A0A369JCT4_HYPMA|nr:hypothetical protein Hypma_000457 [Hypsizygus marmoreus]